jgi:hypothetical protein
MMKKHKTSWRNKPDEANPAMTLWFAIKDQCRRAADLERWPA